MLVPVIIKGKEIFSLIDTGASNNLVQSKIVKDLGLNRVTDDSVVIRRLGKLYFNTLGRIKVDVDIVGLGVKSCCFDIVPDDVIEFDLIFGVQFLKECKFVIDVKRRKISRTLEHGGKICKYHKRDGRLITEIEEEHTVYAAKDVIVANQEMTPIPITTEKSQIKSLLPRFFF